MNSSNNKNEIWSEQSGQRSGLKKNAVLISLGSIERLKLVKEVLYDKYTVTMFLCDFDHNRKAEVRDKDPECEYLHIPPYRRNLSIQRILSLLNYGRQIGEKVNSLHPDLIYIILPPNNMVKNCEHYLKNNPKVRLVLDIYDLWPESLPLRRVRKAFPLKVWAGWRNRNLNNAEAIFTECKLYQKVLKAQGFDYPFETLYLCKNQNSDFTYRVKKHIENWYNNDHSAFRFAYLGSINHIIDIDGIGKVISELVKRGKKVEIDIVGEGESSHQFVQDMREAGATVRYHGPVYDDSLIFEYIGNCDLGINMMKPGVQVGLTTKSIDYLALGIPLLNNIQNDTWDLVQR